MRGHEHNLDKMSWSNQNSIKHLKLLSLILFWTMLSFPLFESHQTTLVWFDVTAPSFWEREDSRCLAVCRTQTSSSLLWPAVRGNLLGTSNSWQTRRYFPAVKVTEISVHDMSHHPLIGLQLHRPQSFTRDQIILKLNARVCKCRTETHTDLIIRGSRLCQTSRWTWRIFWF